MSVINVSRDISIKIAREKRHGKQVMRDFRPHKRTRLKTARKRPSSIPKIPITFGRSLIMEVIKLFDRHRRILCETKSSRRTDE